MCNIENLKKEGLVWEVVVVIGEFLVCVYVRMCVSFLKGNVCIRVFLLFVILLFPLLFKPLSYYLCCCRIFFLTHSCFPSLFKPRLKERCKVFISFSRLTPFEQLHLPAATRKSRKSNRFTADINKQHHICFRISMLKTKCDIKLCTHHILEV